MQIQMYGSDSEREWKIKKHLNVETQRLLEDFTIETKLSVCSVELYSHRQYESIGVQKKRQLCKLKKYFNFIWVVCHAYPTKSLLIMIWSFIHLCYRKNRFSGVFCLYGRIIFFYKRSLVGMGLSFLCWQK